MRIRYRTQQFFGGLFAQVTAGELQEADAVLTPQARRWFHTLPRDLQWHGIQVMHDLQRAGVDRTEVLAAALLHDAGKAAGPGGPVYRAISVLALRLAPAWSMRRSQIDWRAARGLDRVLAIAYQHPQIAAERAAQCGCDPVTIDLIRRHQDRSGAEKDLWLQIFQQIDDQN